MILSKLGQKLRESVDAILSQAAERKFYARIDDDHIVGEEMPKEVFVADEGYFQIRLAEMFIYNHREYWRTFLPFVLMVCEFVFDGAERTVPVFAGNELLKSIETYIKGEAVEYRNSTLIGPTPYSGGKLGLFVGLFRTKSEDIASNLINLVNEISHVFPIGELSQYLSILAPLGHGINSVLGINDVEMRVGVRDEFDVIGQNLLRPGYFVCVNCPEKQLAARQFWVSEGQLWTGNDKPQDRFRDRDYCLVRLGFRAEREFSGLSFAKYWTDIKRLIWDNQQSKAEALFLEFARQLSISPDVTRSHRFNLIRVFKANLELEIQEWSQAAAPLKRTAIPSTRGASWTPGGKGAIQHALLELPNSGKYANARESLRTVAARWDEIVKPFEAGRNVLINDKVIDQQLKTLAGIDSTTGDAAALIDALTYVALRKN